VPIIHGQGVPCIAISSADLFNDLMMARGARFRTTHKQQPTTFKEELQGFLHELRLDEMVEH
jgi:hypothetical protein